MVREIVQAPMVIVSAATNENESNKISWNGAVKCPRNKRFIMVLTSPIMLYSGVRRATQLYYGKYLFTCFISASPVKGLLIKALMWIYSSVGNSSA